MAGDVGAVVGTRVELHVHLCGSIRHETIWELLKEKKLFMPGNGSFHDLRKALLIKEPQDLIHFLQPFAIFLPAIVDDLKALERIAYEFMEDKAHEQVAYVEVRFAPHLFLSPKYRNLEHLSAVIKAIHGGLRKGTLEFNVEFRIILITILGENTEEEILTLCEMHKDFAVVGIDKAGVLSNEDEVPKDGKLPQMFQKAARLGLHRTVHAGESGPAEMVRRAVNLYQAERIGHGYNVVNDWDLYQDCLKRKIHFETCPWSSLLTGAVSPVINKHPIVKFAEDKANFGISTDDSTVTGYGVKDNIWKIQEWGLNEADCIRATINAAKAAFLPEAERNQLIRMLKRNILGENDNNYY